MADMLICSLCGSAEDDVEHMFTGLHGVACSDCVEECWRLLDRQRRSRQQRETMAALDAALTVNEERA